MKLGEIYSKGTVFYAQCDGPDKPGYWCIASGVACNSDGSSWRKENDELSEAEAINLGIVKPNIERIKSV